MNSVNYDIFSEQQSEFEMAGSFGVKKIFSQSETSPDKKDVQVATVSTPISLSKKKCLNGSSTPTIEEKISILNSSSQKKMKNSSSKKKQLISAFGTRQEEQESKIEQIGVQKDEIIRILEAHSNRMDDLAREYQAVSLRSLRTDLKTEVGHMFTQLQNSLVVDIERMIQGEITQRLFAINSNPVQSTKPNNMEELPVLSPPRRRETDTSVRELPPKKGPDSSKSSETMILGHKNEMVPKQSKDSSHTTGKGTTASLRGYEQPPVSIDCVIKKRNKKEMEEVKFS